NRQQQGVGDWLMFRLDDEPELRRVMDYLIRYPLAPRKPNGDAEVFEAVHLALQLPLTGGVKIGNQQDFEVFMRQLAGLLDTVGPYSLERRKHRDVPITRIQFDPKSQVTQFMRQEKLPALYHAQVDDAWYVSLRETPLKE